ncbi:GNAT family N-acetyltransferase [Clostridium sp. BL-8]|uniref:GNAT family N-acetyltransferase n=1 Tax=Clostridium sp. BL-8 TaxID=349938 RepID=UPI00098C9A18|nr:GNAT family N-acetyltransferase [Clostridium sp. BL-8]OOM80543.1 protease synthase and sporulation negative regulatory protein PAI 1 [Clostridium sp. BL-8]
MDIKIISSENRNQINEFIMSHWFSTDMVVRGEIVDMRLIDGFVMYDNEEIIGLVTYRVKASECEIMSLDSLMERQGIGTVLLNKVIEVARGENCSKVKIITTNDNINALGFYQQRGFDMVNLYHNALNDSRKLKPSIPLVGDFGIPLMHEIEFEMNLDK